LNHGKGFHSAAIFKSKIMNIGDKVRMLHGREEGVITRFLEGQLVEVEIEDGFKIPILRSELAVVSNDESRLFKREATTEAETKQWVRGSAVFAAKGVYMAFLPLNDREMSLYLLNNSDWEIPFVMGEENAGQYKGLAGGVLKRKTSLKVRDMLVAQFEAWPTFVVQLLFHKQGTFALPLPLVRKMRFRANTFFKSKQKAPLLDRDAHLFQLDQDNVEVQPEKIVDKMQMQNQPIPAPLTSISKPAPTIDLHIEQLIPDHSRMSKTEILKIQVEMFEKQFENAIASGMPDITFIHGVGNGTLRMELHKRLSRHKHVQFFEDAQKEKFGYGATKVKIK
jgi:hypothetical protein